MNLTRMVIFSALLAATSGCHYLRGKTGCHADQEYRHAEQLPALKGRSRELLDRALATVRHAAVASDGLSGYEIRCGSREKHRKSN